MNIQEFMNQHDFNLVCDKINLKDIDKDGWKHTSYACRLIYQEKSMDFPYHMGIYYTEEPKIGQVLESLILDCQCGEYETFEGFCDEFGYDTDSRKAQKAYEHCKKIKKGMKRLLGEELYQQYLQLEE